ncbi:hypothetical protein [Thioalkalivibrio sp. AKL10]|uniref:hypothetical protein n=1 Tax=Thioalkalivibrio sp. AKL10 TaxID=1158158 RepID=UPI0003638FE5|nr:hypothetical protein [Thioalkalivibrio sp. AKL10]
MNNPAIQTCGDPALQDALVTLFARYGLRLVVHPPQAPLPGSWWGEPEAGIVGHDVHVRPDTPIHSALHEAGHVICMDAGRRATLHTNAGGDDLEECGVCYLQILLADEIPGVGRERLMRDMDAWGYSFRLGNTAAWFREDAADARGFLQAHDLIDAADRPRFACRGAASALPASGSDATLAPVE